MDRPPVRLGRRHVLATALGALLAPPWWRPAVAETADARAEAVVVGLAEHVWALIQSSELDQRARLDRLTELLESNTDVALLSRLVLGRYWQRLSEDQQVGYEQLFGEVVLRSLARRLDQYAYGSKGPLDQHFSITGSLPAGKEDVLVRSKVVPPSGGCGQRRLAAAHAGRPAGDHRPDHRGREPPGLAAVRVRGGDRAQRHGGPARRAAGARELDQVVTLLTRTTKSRPLARPFLIAPRA